ncbi:MAG: hypothetical protein GH151_02385 [Bacteroidetes bacterium]|nr:hypothetical protein [Bacteroidota bacterium]
MGKNVEPNCIRLVRDLVTFELGIITCQGLIDLAEFGGGRGDWFTRQ